jgi:hypothetical protein
MLAISFGGFKHKQSNSDGEWMTLLVIVNEARGIDRMHLTAKPRCIMPSDSAVCGLLLQLLHIPTV